MTRDIINILCGIASAAAVYGVFNYSPALWIPTGIAALVLLHFGAN